MEVKYSLMASVIVTILKTKHSTIAALPERSVKWIQQGLVSHQRSPSSMESILTDRELGDEIRWGSLETLQLVVKGLGPAFDHLKSSV
mgnify:CR=1 FL=1